jgi:D-glycerate 3-kinase
MPIKNLDAFLKQQALPSDYGRLVSTWFLPLSRSLATLQALSARPILVGINGCQGSGKSTLAALLCLLLEQEAGLKAINLSLDDFYLGHAERQRLGQDIHPLLSTRGVPGTHDIPLMQQTLSSLLSGHQNVAIPRFDKALDDLVPISKWPFCSQPDVVIWEGWCLGVRPQSEAQLSQPVNALEADEDLHGHWRQYVNQRLADDYLPLFDSVDTWVMLRAPGFDSVLEWRHEQEEKCRRSLSGPENRHRLMTRKELSRFIQYYQRITEQALAQLPTWIDHLYLLDEQRNIRGYSGP